jgi:predicted GNAT family acetyltransferase
MPIEYPDAAGYPDGTGTLDEGTAALVDEVTVVALRAVDRPSTETDSEITMHRDDDAHLYVAAMGERELASLRYREVAGRVVLLTTNVAPEFRGRGIATDLIADALDDIRERGLRITVYCPVVASFVAAHPQHADVIDREHPGF